MDPKPHHLTIAATHPYHPSTVVEDARVVGVLDGLLPICEDNGDFYCITESGEILYWSHDGATDERWPGLATWINEIRIDGT